MDLEARPDRDLFLWALLIATLAHVVFFSLTLPESEPSMSGRPAATKAVFVVQQAHFRPKLPKPVKTESAKKLRRKKIPIPDPTPDEPEPIFTQPVELPEIDAPDTDIMAVFGIPEGPPGVGGEERADRSPLYLGGAVKPPVPVYRPQPRYSEEARRARLEGVVVLQTVIDENGNVSQIEVLRGLTLGLTESALETVQEWKYQPATLRGEPVAVYFHIVVRFSLQ